MDKELRNKIIELFEYRKLPELIALGNNGILNESLYEKLIQLQYHIYLLDDILESNWDVPPKSIMDAWKDIHEDLTILGVGRAQVDDYSKHIYKYQRHELELRQQKLPNRLSMEYFYFYKSCDVKLLRRIVYDHYPALKRENKLSEWRVFDLITEINDDIEDIYEDLYTINGNRFLLGILIEGKDKTKERYASFLQSLQPRLSNNSETIDKMTKEVYALTLKLLDKTIGELDDEKISQAIIINKLSLTQKKTQSIDG